MAKGRRGPYGNIQSMGRIPVVTCKHLIDPRDNDAKFFVKERVEVSSMSPNEKG